MELTIENVEQLHISLDAHRSNPLLDMLIAGGLASAASAAAKSSSAAPAPASAVAPSPITPSPVSASAPRIGTDWPEQGGVLAGVMRGIDGGPDYYLIVPREDFGTRRDVPWSSTSSCVDENDKRDGLANTRSMVISTDSFEAAQWAYGLTGNGFSDWYLPSQAELETCHANVPELFESGWYWSSTQYSDDYAWYQYFDVGAQDFTDKYAKGRARAVRRFIP